MVNVNKIKVKINDNKVKNNVNVNKINAAELNNADRLEKLL